MSSSLSKGHWPKNLDALRRYDTCTLANALEQLKIRPRNEGFISSGPVCQFPHFPVMVGHAVVGRIQTYMPPVTGACYYENIDWWKYLVTIPPPRVIVLQDFDSRPGFGALFGEVHARISQAFSCTGFVTNGAVRDLAGVEAAGLQVFAGSVSVSHAYAHVVDYGEPIEIGGLLIKAGDILHGDRHGVLSIPTEAAESLPAIADQISREEKELFALTERPDFSAEMLGTSLQGFSKSRTCT